MDRIIVGFLYDNSASLCCYILEKDIKNYLRTDFNRLHSIVRTKSKSIVRIDEKNKKRPTHEEESNVANIRASNLTSEEEVEYDKVAEDLRDYIVRTIERIIEHNLNELLINGYEVLRGKRLKNLVLEINKQDATDIHVGSKVTQLGVFSFKGFLNIGMLLTEGERAKLLRQAILDIVIDVINKKTGGSIKYIKQRDEDFLSSAFEEENYRKRFTNSLKDYVDMGAFKYLLYTNKIYQSIFKEKANEYR